MKKILFFAAMLSFAVACGGNQQQDNAEEAAQTPEAAVEAVETEAEAEAVVAPQPEEVTANKAEAFQEKKLEVGQTLDVAVATAEQEDGNKLTVSEIKPEKKPVQLEVKEGKKSELKVNGDLKVSDSKLKVGTAEATK